MMGWVAGCSEYQKFASKINRFDHNIRTFAKKYFEICDLFVVVLECLRRENVQCSQIEQHLEVKIEDCHKAP